MLSRIYRYCLPLLLLLALPAASEEPRQLIVMKLTGLR